MNTSCDGKSFDWIVIKWLKNVGSYNVLGFGQGVNFLGCR